MLLVAEERAVLGGGGVFIGPSPPVLPSICILILYKSAACSMGLSEMDAQVYNTLGRRYGNEGNIIPRSHNPPPTHPPPTEMGKRRPQEVRLVTTRCLAQMSLWSDLRGRGQRSGGRPGRQIDGFGAVAQEMCAAFNNATAENNAALIGVKLLLIGVYGGPLSRRTGRRGEAVSQPRNISGAAAR